MRSSISLYFLIVMTSSFACPFSKTASRYCLPFSVNLKFIEPSNSQSTSASLLWWTNSSVYKTSFNLLWGKTSPLCMLLPVLDFYLHQHYPSDLCCNYHGHLRVWISPYWLEWCDHHLVYQVPQHYPDWLFYLLNISFVHQMIVSAYTTNVTGHLQWVKYGTNLLKVWNVISHHQEITTIH